MNTQNPEPTPIDVERLLDDHLSPARTVALIALGGVGLTEAVALSTLLATEPEPLPAATVTALSLVAAAGLAWTIFALWRLRTKQVLLLKDRVIGALMATAFTTAATIGGVTIALDRNERGGAAAVAVGGAALLVSAVVMLGGAVVDHRRARQRLAMLTGSA